MLPLAEKDWIVEHLMEPARVTDGTLGWILMQVGIGKHVVSLFAVAALMLAVFPKIAKDEGLVPTGLRNFFEVILLFIRDEIARPFLGHNTDKFLPVLWNFFFFVLFCNLFGLVPGMATATGQIWVTGTLAFTAFCWYHAAGIWEQGLLPYIKNIVPGGLPIWLIPVLFAIEIFGHIFKPIALMIRLWANMTGGHAVLYAFLGLIFSFQSYKIAPLACGAAVAVYMLEIFVAFIQAYVFTFLVTVFLGAAVHPEH